MYVYVCMYFYVLLHITAFLQALLMYMNLCFHLSVLRAAPDSHFLSNAL